jgi:hypothetical protein
MIRNSNRNRELIRQWRQQMAVHWDPRRLDDRLGFVAITYLDQSKANSRFVDIRNLLVTLMLRATSAHKTAAVRKT